MPEYVSSISDEFVDSYKSKRPPWGPVGYLVYKRTYARRIDRKNRTEEWWETIKRCCNGILYIGGKFTKEEIETLYDKVFNLKCSFSGRALWQLGTPTVEKLGGDSLMNCWCISIDSAIEPFCFVFNELMLGGGVGFNIQKEYVFDIPKVVYDVDVIRKDEKDVDFIVPDNREGWVDLLRRILSAFFYTGKSFTYSTICVRGKGSPIRSFGGTASGPEDLCEGMEEICKIIKLRVGKKLRPIDCLDILNLIAGIVVAGNVRRCLPKGAMVHTYRGLIKIENVIVGDEVLTSNGYSRVSNTFQQGIQRLSIIKTHNGYFECTPNHKMAVMTTLNEYIWKMASDLLPRDRLITTTSTCKDIKPDLIPTEVIEVIHGRKAETFDIEVEDSHEFFCNGYLTHNSAQLALGDMDDRQYLDAKNWSKGNIPNWRDKSNNSVACNDIEYLPAKFWSGYNGDGEPYGLINLKNCQTYGRLIDGRGYRPDNDVVGVNPCLSGESLVYLADGRGHVPIRNLAKEGMDVPVFCLDNNSKVTVRYMRNPRFTGRRPVYKIVLDDGSCIRQTENHKFLTTSGSYVKVCDLKPGDGIRMLTKYEASIKDIFSQRSNSKDYWWLSFGQASTKSEHRLISEFVLGRKLTTGEVVHHIDHDSKNNSFSNLKVMNKKSHDEIHTKNMFGDKNPMRRAKYEWSKEKWDSYKSKQSGQSSGLSNKNCCGETNESLRKHALDLTKELGHIFSRQEWIDYAEQNGLPKNFSKWRVDHLGSVAGLSQWAALQLGYSPELLCLHKKTLRTYSKLTNAGYECKIVDGIVSICKKCEICGKDMLVPHTRRETGVCSSSCMNVMKWKQKRTRDRLVNGMRSHHMSRKNDIRDKQLKVFLELRNKIGRIPSKKEWKTECIYLGISSEISRKSSPFRFWDDLKEAASSFNHRIVSITYDGEEDVYNGTVDEFHNFFVGGFESNTKNGKSRILYANNLQCGEIPLESGESCNLSEIFLPKVKDEEEFKQIAGLLVKVTKTISCLPCVHEITSRVVSKNHRLGIGVTGFLQAPHLRKEEIFNNVYKHVENTDREYSKVLGVKQSIKLTATKPSGTLSLLCGVTPGVHPAYAKYYLRRIRMASDDMLVDVCRKNGYHVEPVLRFDGTHDRNTMVVSFPIKSPEEAVLAKDLSAVELMEWHKWLQSYWSDNAVSVTIYYRKEELPEIQKWLSENYNDSIKTISFCLHQEHGFTQAPLEEITEEQYQKMVSKTKPIDSLNDEDSRDLADSLECAGGACPIK